MEENKVILDAQNEVAYSDNTVVIADSSKVGAEGAGNATAEAQSGAAENETAAGQKFEMPDFEQMSKSQITEYAVSISRHENFKFAEEAFKSMRLLVKQFDEEAKAEAKAKFLADNEGQEEGFEFKNDETTQAFYDAQKAFKNFKNSHYEKQEKDKEGNLALKNALVDELRNIIDNDKALNKQSAKVKELQERWKKTGHVPQANANELNQTFSALLTLYYSQRNMEFDLQQLDREKNLEIKNAICARAEELLKETNLMESVNRLISLHQEYKETGPVPKEEQDKIWNRFKAASDIIYEKRRAQAEEYKGQLKENMELKRSLCLLLEPFVNFESDRINEWNDKTKELLAIQKDWEKVGAAPKEVAKSLNKQFWANFKSFFSRKNLFFEKLESQREENLKNKTALCELAESLKDNGDWNETTDKLKVAQDEWRKIGPVPEKYKDKIYERFKKACDAFFENKRNRRGQQDQEFTDNFEGKANICKQIDALASEKPSGFEQLDALIADFGKVGFVPKKKIGDAQEMLFASVSRYVDGMEASDSTKQKALAEYKSKIIREAGSGHHAVSEPKGGNSSQGTDMAIRKKITAIEDDIALWKNNLEFFAKSKTADKLRAEFNGKIQEAEEEIKSLKVKLKALTQKQ